MGSGRHISGQAAKRQQLGEMERDDERLTEAACEAENLFGDSFVPVDAVPSIQVMKNNSEAMSFQLQTDEEKEMTRRVLRYLNDPKKEDPDNHPICREDFSDQLQGAQAVVEQVFAGNLGVVDPDIGGNGLLENVMSTAGLWASPSLSAM